MITGQRISKGQRTGKERIQQTTDVCEKTVAQNQVTLGTLVFVLLKEQSHPAAPAGLMPISHNDYMELSWSETVCH